MTNTSNRKKNTCSCGEAAAAVDGELLLSLIRTLKKRIRETEQKYNESCVRAHVVL